jgi:hypothetical protein
MDVGMARAGARPDGCDIRGELTALLDTHFLVCRRHRPRPVKCALDSGVRAPVEPAARLPQGAAQRAPASVRGMPVRRERSVPRGLATAQADQSPGPRTERRIDELRPDRSAAARAPRLQPATPGSARFPQWRRSCSEPFGRIGDETCPDRVQHDVAAKLQQIGVLVHQDGLVASLQDVPHSLVAAIERLGVNTETPFSRRMPRSRLASGVSISR